MPFPFAHPAAVLPLRRYRSSWLNFPALVIGSIVPDAGYLIPQTSDLSHQVLGSLAFGLPVGGLVLMAFYALRMPVVVRMPPPLRRSLVPVCQRPLGPVWIAVVSLMIGIWTHILWDSITHNDGWLVEQVPFLLTPVLQFSGRTARVVNILWYVSSIVGAGWLFLAFEKWKRGAVTAAGGTVENRGVIQDAASLAILVVPISLIHHLIRSPIGFVMTGALCIFLGVLLIAKMAATSES